MRFISVILAPMLLLGIAGAFSPFQLLAPDGRISFESVERFANDTALEVGDAEIKRNKRSAVASPLDIIIDFILAFVVPQIVSHGDPAIPIQDFSFEMKANMENVYKFSGWISASGGSLKNMKSLFRQGPAVVRRESSKVLLLQVSAGIQVLNLSYKNYNASFGTMKFHGQMEGEVSQPIITAAVEMVAPCTIRLRSLEMTHIGKLQMKITGLPQVISTFPSAVEHLFDQPDVRNEITKTVIDEGKAILQGVFKKLSCK